MQLKTVNPCILVSKLDCGLSVWIGYQRQVCQVTKQVTSDSGIKMRVTQRGHKNSLYYLCMQKIESLVVCRKLRVWLLEANV